MAQASPSQEKEPRTRNRAESYQVDFSLRKEFTTSEMTEYQRIFRAFDSDNNGAIDRSELGDVMKALGMRNITNEAIDALIAEVDLNNNKTIEFAEFLALNLKMKQGQVSKDTGMGGLVTKAGALTQVKSTSGGVHSFAEEEKTAFAEHINRCLGKDKDLAYMMPINPQNNDLFSAAANGVLICKLINCAVPGTIDERALNVKPSMNVFQQKENLNLCLEAAKSIGCTVVNIHPTDIMEGRPHLILGLVWQIVKMQLLSTINLKNYPELIRLLEEGEELGDLLKLGPDTLLLRWFNYHLKNANSPRRVANFSGDIKDAEAYTVLLHQIAPAACDLSGIALSNVNDRATKVLRDAAILGVDSFIKPSDIVKGNSRLNLAFCASIFNTCHGLAPPTEEEAYLAAGLLDDDVEGSREERAFRMWINSLAIEDVYINNLYEAMKDGVVLLKVIDRVVPSTVQWRQVTFKANNKFKRVGNCNYAVVLGKQLKMTLVNIGGTDIADGNKKLILGFTWQLMRLHSLQIIGNLTDNELLEFANNLVQVKGRTTRVTSFRDPSIRCGRFLLDFLWAVEPRAINWDLVTPGESDADCEANAKYVLSVARKLGATVFMLWEDIVDVNPKMILTFIAAVAQLVRNKGASTPATESPSRAVSSPTASAGSPSPFKQQAASPATSAAKPANVSPATKGASPGSWIKQNK